MSWYYAENNERRGPIDDDALQALVAAGTIRPDTLVWREGLAAWVPYRQAAAGVAGPSATTPADASARACSHCGKLFPADEMIELAGRSICAGCKPLVVQHMIEGTGGDGGVTFIDPAQFLADLRARGGYRIRIGSVLSRAWATVTANFFPCVGVTLLVYLIMGVSQNIPCLGLLAPFLLTGPLIGGIYFYFLKQLRGQPAVVGDAFNGFNKPHYGRLALTGTMTTLIILAAAAVLIGPGVALNWTALQDKSGEPPTAFIVWCFVAVLPLMYLGFCWLLSYALVIDKGLEFWPAMELSRQVVNMNLGGWLLCLLVNALLSLAGMMVLCVGLLVVMPVSVCSLMVIYEDIFSSRPGPTA